MRETGPTSWQGAAVTVKAARAAGMAGATWWRPLRGELSVSAAGWSWVPDVESAARGAIRIQPADGWALVEVRSSRFGTDAMLARRSGEFLPLLVRQGRGLSRWVVDADGGYPLPAFRPGQVALQIFVTLLAVGVSGLMFWIGSLALPAASGTAGTRAAFLCLGFGGGILAFAITGYAVVGMFRRERDRRQRIQQAEERPH